MSVLEKLRQLHNAAAAPPVTAATPMGPSDYDWLIAARNSFGDLLDVAEDAQRAGLRSDALDRLTK